MRTPPVCAMLVALTPLWLGACAQASQQAAEPARAHLAADDVPRDEQAPERGRQVFLSSACVYCHAVDGTNAKAVTGPVLTHFASRDTIAGVVENTRENLRVWIRDPQAIKPGTPMPGTDMPDDSLEALIGYLMSLE